MRILALFLALLAVPVFADVACVRVDTSVTNLPTTFSTSAASLVIQGVRNARGFLVDNRIGSELAINCSSSATTAPASTGSNVFYVNGSNAWVIDNSYSTGNCYVRSNTGSVITTGVFQICIIGG
jgi:hypothetical protein